MLCYCIVCLDEVRSICCVYFFKQKTAYEMRISDWSSDVCSSDLPPGGNDRIVGAAAHDLQIGREPENARQRQRARTDDVVMGDDVDRRRGIARKSVV